jgi:uncharacterized protein YbjT (DUF2867 family)
MGCSVVSTSTLAIHGSSAAGTGRQGVIDPRDVAAVAARVLTSAGHDGNTYTLTGPHLLSVPDQATQLEAALGHTLAVADVSADTTGAQMLAAAIPRTLWTDDVQGILGHPPRTFSTWVRDHQDAFR